VAPGIATLPFCRCSELPLPNKNRSLKQQQRFTFVRLTRCSPSTVVHNIKGVRLPHAGVVVAYGCDAGEKMIH
jgi:hypothetical protein